MAVQILNHMPDAEIHRGERADVFLRALEAPRKTARVSGRALFMAATVALHALAAVAFLGVRNQERSTIAREPMVAMMLESPASEAETPPEYSPPANVVYSLQLPEDLSFESDAIALEVTNTAIAPSAPQAVTPPLIESVEYVRAPAPVYPTESSRKRERGTVLLRVLVDPLGRPAQIQVERSSGFTRLDSAARDAVQKALFRPHEVNGIAQPAQVLIPIEFTRRAS